MKGQVLLLSVYGYLSLTGLGQTKEDEAQKDGTQKDETQKGWASYPSISFGSETLQVGFREPLPHRSERLPPRSERTPLRTEHLPNRSQRLPNIPSRSGSRTSLTKYWIEYTQNSSQQSM
jgi:hypothetical protein